MSVNLENISGIEPINSITTTKSDPKTDQYQPYTYTQWLSRTGIRVSDTGEYVALYNKYLRDWTRAHELSDEASRVVVTDRYRAVLTDIVLNHTTDEERRILTNVDSKNDRLIETALPFFADKLKQIALYYAHERDNIKQIKKKLVMSGSVQGMSRDIYKLILEAHIHSDNSLPEIDALSQSCSVDLIELYDMSRSYFSQDRLPIKVDLWLAFENAVKDVLNECSPILSLPGMDAISIAIQAEEEAKPVTMDDISDIFPERFFDYNKTPSHLNLYKEKDFIPTLLGGSVNYLSGGTVTPVVESTSAWRNIFNRYAPSINNVIDLTELKSVYEIGRFFLPEKMSTLTYYSHKPTPVVTDDNITAVLPDINKYGNSAHFGVTGLPVDHIEDVTWLKVDISNGELFGDLVYDKTFPRFYDYSSIEESNATPIYGVSRSTDSFEFFRGKRNDLWDNPDVFEQVESNIYPIDERQSTLLVGHDTLYRWRSDIFGNEYSMYKQIRPPRGPEDRINPQDAPEVDHESRVICALIDGGDTLRTRLTRFDDDVEYDIYDGGRHPGTDPKVEQSLISRPFPDIRREILVEGGRTVKEEHNTFYFGSEEFEEDPKIHARTFHGFRYPEPYYDEQAYGGLFIDDTCGALDPSSLACSVRDNYAFRVFSEETDTGYVSRDRSGMVYNDVFSEYFNPGYDNFDPDLGFTNHGSPVSAALLGSDTIDAQYFTTSHCNFEDQMEFIDEADSNVPVYYDTLSVSDTEMSEKPDLSALTPTLYEQKTKVVGNCYFRSYTGVVSPLSAAIGNIINNYSNYDDYSFNEIDSSIRAGNIIDMDVVYDIMVLQTPEHIIFEKLNYNAETDTIQPSNVANIIISTHSFENEMVKPINWFFDDKNSLLIVGKTATTPSGVVYPVLYGIDVNTLQGSQIYPPVAGYSIEDSWSLTGELSSCVISSIDEPLLSYNDKSDQYNLTYSATVSSSSGNMRCVCMSNYQFSYANLKLLDNTVIHTGYYDDHGDATSTFSQKTIRLSGTPGDIPTTGTTTKYLSLSSMQGAPLSSYELEFIVDTRSIPVTGKKITSIAYSPGDGSPTYTNFRNIDQGLDIVDFDITELPDQSDFADPRRHGFSHTYHFAGQVSNVYTAAVTATYSDFSKLVYNIDIETDPYTISSGFGDIKLVDSKPYIDLVGNNKQLIVLETQNPRYISTVAIDIDPPPELASSRPYTGFKYTPTNTG